MKLFVVLIAAHGKVFLLEHYCGGTAIFPSEKEAIAHVERVRETGIEYSVAELMTRRVRPIPNKNAI